MSQINYHHYILATEGNNITLITDITSDLPLSKGYPVWKVSDRDLPPNAEVHNETIGKVLHNTLLLFNLSFLDSGNYTIIVGNACGLSSAFVYIDVQKGMSQLFLFLNSHQLFFIIS